MPAASKGGMKGEATSGVKRIFAHSFMPAASPKALTRISRECSIGRFNHRNDKSLNELAAMYNPSIRGWITYYSHFYPTQLRPTLRRIDAYVIRWVRRKYKRMVHRTKGARDWFDRLRRANPTLFAHWSLCHGSGRASGAVLVERLTYGSRSAQGESPSGDSSKRPIWRLTFHRRGRVQSGHRRRKSALA